MNRATATPEPLLVKSHQVAGLYAITLDTPETNDLERMVRQVLAGGARIIQYRSKSLDTAFRCAQANALLALCRSASVPFIINNDLDLVLATGADGLHLGRDDGDVAAARAKLGRSKLLGVSCYNQLDLAIAASAQGADYIAFGSAYPSRTKPQAVRAPLRLYREAKKRLSLPVVAIGGITPENAARLVDAGVDAVAVISALFDAPDVEAAARRFSSLFQRE